jgi:hypothetical protein
MANLVFGTPVVRREGVIILVAPVD